MPSIRRSAWGYILFFTIALAACRVDKISENATKISMSFSDNTTIPQPGPVNPIPDSLWKPAKDSTPTSGNYVYLVSDAGDKVGQGLTYTFTQDDATLTITSNGGYLSIIVNGTSNWLGEFKTKDSLNEIQKGYYAGLLRYSYHDVLWGGLNWSKNSVSCAQLEGWVAIDKVSYMGTKLSALDMRFEQRCDGSANALRGQIHWAL